MKKTKTEAFPGKPIVMKLREDEETVVLDWINLQTVYSDSIRYLIQKEIAENGLRNLQHFIPQFRTVETLKSINVISSPESIRIVTQHSAALREDPPVSIESVSPTSSSHHQKEENVTAADLVSDRQQETSPAIVDAGNQNNVVNNKPESNSSTTGTTDNQSSSSHPGPKKPKKVFGDDVTKSYAN
ncbi:hypothetical protein GZH47_31630 (plasmid) [Paenibacillus rhizovicinus]|uniref:Uncharacterized protein n=1 Tax=Paenibacillus rhizovicinus TaxID=2704463 RepID=A0A6C0PAP7_9BACL|nr:hypothetical protein [Paenibacillus rhizovicinus]QHW35451.1 hypothetical protein GZH47_31630 [Paenibacillus rhizovicinus]